MTDTTINVAPPAAQTATASLESDAPRRGKRPWKPGILTCSIGVLLLAGSGVLLYPSTAQWVTSYNQSQIISDVGALVDEADPDASTQLRQAHDYNAALTTGVKVKANTNVPTGDGVVSGMGFDYSNILRVNADGLMARIRIPGINVDLPVYHGTSDTTLLRGAGHLEGSSLPVGGESSHSVITAHRGLAGASMFTHLDRVQVGDRFTIEVFGEVLTYEVRETKVVAPENTDSLRAESGKDLLTLITCTPLGINTHRILVTGERITPTPQKDMQAAGETPDIPGFPWWIVGMSAAILAAGSYVWWSGYGDARSRQKRGELLASEPAEPKLLPRELDAEDTARFFKPPTRIPGAIPPASTGSSRDRP